MGLFIKILSNEALKKGYLQSKKFDLNPNFIQLLESELELRLTNSFFVALTSRKDYIVTACSSIR